MLAFIRHNLVFLAVPKTGTTAYESALAPHADVIVSNPPALKHCNLRRYFRQIRPFLEQGLNEPLETLAVMREPISWLGSWYRYRQRPALIGKPNSTQGISFDQFVLAYLDPTPPPFANVSSQAKFLASHLDAPTLSYLFCYENQGPLIDFLSKRLDVRLDIKPKNISPQADLYLAPKTKALLMDRLQDDFALYEHLQHSQPQMP